MLLIGQPVKPCYTQAPCLTRASTFPRVHTHCLTLFLGSLFPGSPWPSFVSALPRQSDLYLPPRPALAVVLTRVIV